MVTRRRRRNLKRWVRLGWGYGNKRLHGRLVGSVGHARLLVAWCVMAGSVMAGGLTARLLLRAVINVQNPVHDGVVGLDV